MLFSIARVVPFALALLAIGADTAVVAAPQAVYVAMPDGVRLAVDVHRPADAAPAPTVLLMTRYGRRGRLSQGARETLIANGVAVVLADMRGTGATFGDTQIVFSAEERADTTNLLDWIASQTWSDGRIIVTGASYDGNLAELAVASGHASVVGAIPRFIDFDTYRDLALPGGVRNDMLLRAWGELTRELDTSEGCLTAAAACGDFPHAAPVDSDTDRSALRAALLEHQRNWRVFDATRGFAFEDDVAPSGRAYRDGYLSSFNASWAASRTPAQLWASWLDARTADSALARFVHTPNAPLELVIGAWAHGGGTNVDPFLPSGASELSQGAEILSYVATLLSERRPPRRVRYYTLGAGVWRETAQWPPAGLATRRWSFQADGALQQTTRPRRGVDVYEVDFAATTGAANRWTTQLGGPVAYSDRGADSGRRLAYTSAPLDRAIEVTGEPVAHLSISASRPDGAVFVYLEAVAPDGRVLYITEGQKRIGFRDGENFARADFHPPAPGEVFDLTVPLGATSVVIEPGWCLRVAIAGADADTFARYPGVGPQTYTITRGGVSGSYIELPQKQWRQP